MGRRTTPSTRQRLQGRLRPVPPAHHLPVLRQEPAGEAPFSVRRRDPAQRTPPSARRRDRTALACAVPPIAPRRRCPANTDAYEPGMLARPPSAGRRGGRCFAGPAQAPTSTRRNGPAQLQSATRRQALAGADTPSAIQRRAAQRPAARPRPSPSGAVPPRATRRRIAQRSPARCRATPPAWPRLTPDSAASPSARRRDPDQRVLAQHLSARQASVPASAASPRAL